MEKEKLTCIEEAGLIFEQLGMTRMAGRVFGFLLVCDLDEASFDQIQNALGASKGSISNTTRQLIQIRFVEPVSLPGDRKTYYRITNMEVGKLLKSRMQLLSKFAETLESARHVKKRDDSISAWILEASTFYSWIGHQMDKVIDKWNREKDEILKQAGQTNENRQTE